jgi:hydroxyacylglutathione hydrolase
LKDEEQMPLKVATLPVTPFQQNCAVLWDEATRRAALVDPGGDVPRIRSALAKLDVQVEKIVLTHGHIDHAGGAAEVAELLGGLPIEGPDERDRFLLDQLAEQGRMYGLTDARAVTPTRWLKEGDTVDTAGTSFAVLHCPGHTPGHIVLVDEPGRFAIVGDVLFKGSIGRSDFPYGDGAGLVRSIREKLFTLGDDIRFICGHTPASTFGDERRSNPFVGENAR